MCPGSKCGGPKAGQRLMKEMASVLCVYVKGKCGGHGSRTVCCGGGGGKSVAAMTAETGCGDDSGAGNRSSSLGTVLVCGKRRLTASGG